VKTEAAGTTWRGILSGPRGGLTIGLTLLTLAVATESLVITAIMPAIVRDIGGLSLYGLAFSAFFLAGLVSIPIAGWGVDRFGPSVPFAATISIFLLGTLVAAVSPNMPVLVLARAAQGLGAAAQFTISQSTIARAYPQSARIRVLSLMSATWILPSLLGPSIGAAIAALLGWRWAFGLILLPALAAAAFTYPRLRHVRPTPGAAPRPAVRRPLQVAAGTGLLVTGLTNLSWWSVPLSALGLVLAVEALVHTLPPGTMRARRGLPAIVAASFFLNLGFYGAASFVPLVLVGVRGTTVIAASLGIKVANGSYGGPGSDDGNCGNTNLDVEHMAVCSMVAAGVTFVVAAGNENSNMANSTPAAYNEVLTVTAVADFNGQPGGGAAQTCGSPDVDDTNADFSNWTTIGSSDVVHTIAGPGKCIFSTWMGGGYNTISGTSMATPHLTGTVALCISSGACAGMTPAQIIAKLRADAAARPASYGFTGDPNSPLGSHYYGYLVYAGGY